MGKSETALSFLPSRVGKIKVFSRTGGVDALRIDIAYFTDSEAAERDAKLFALMRG